MKFILGKKIEMLQKFAADGSVIPVTAVLAGPCVVTQLKNKETDGYNAVQFGFDLKKKLSKPEAGHLKDLGNFRFLSEYRLLESENIDLKRGSTVDVTVFTPGDKVMVTGTSKGKGFQGVVKRHGFHGSPATHGHKDQIRMPGSIGAGGPGRVFKGVRMAGRMGGDQISVKNLEIVAVDKDNNMLFIKGAIPGTRYSLVEIRGI